MASDESDTSSAADQALRWFTLLKSGDAIEDDRRRFQSWIDAEAIHRLEFEKLSGLWADLEGVKPFLQEELARMAFDRAASDISQGPRRGLTRHAAWISSALAACLLVFIGTGWWWASRVDVVEYRTAKGEQRTVTLTDGSTITMNTESRVRTEFSAARRLIVLQQGEALFTVSHEPGRPFDVAAGSGVVCDIGTQFIVRRQTQNVIVTVVEGAVEVRSGPDVSPPGESRQVLTAGQQLSYGQDGRFSAVKSVSLLVSTAWVDGKVLFEGRPLSEVVEEIGRYQDGEIRILDPEIAAINVSGAFNIRDRDGFLKALERAVPVKASRVNQTLVVLERKSLP